MESSLFDFQSCDGDVEVMTYYDVTLMGSVGKFQAGEKFDSASLDAEKGELSLYRNSLVGRYKVGLAVLSDMLESEEPAPAHNYGPEVR